MEEFERLLRAHDWTYEMSDDQNQWRAGADARERLLRMAAKFPLNQVYEKVKEVRSDEFGEKFLMQLTMWGVKPVHE